MVKIGGVLNLNTEETNIDKYFYYVMAIHKGVLDI